MNRLPYPSQPLGEPEKDFDDTFRLSQAIKRAMNESAMAKRKERGHAVNSRIIEAGLGPQLRPYEETHGVAEVLREEFFRS
jgi:hypothetical protein